LWGFCICLFFCVYYTKYNAKKACIKNARVEFQCAWLTNPTTCHEPIKFLEHLQQIDDMAMWVREAICDHHATTMEPINEDLHLSIMPSFTTLDYKKMKAYGNHFRVDDESFSLCVTFDSGVASLFEQVEGNGNDLLGPIQYVGLLKQFLQLDYGPISSPILLFRCN
jgi:hypothetical protein